MQPETPPASHGIRTEEDGVEHVPGYGVPSQDPRPAAQIQLAPEEAERESRSVLMGGGVMAGAATGAAVGVAVAGPIGVVVGGAVGGVAGAFGGAAAGKAIGTDDPAPATPPGVGEDVPPRQ
ncbi:bacteriocin [Acidovorax sp. NCPPB 4044]|uniref:bacteriocin n=1 Tax=Acidovorax sp. NCPPB 4044 TaxID=2940490 RepID=UPI002303CC15|nr:bacteriocin [Acidovorax sp. NCPPB 4044]MDA8522890.1 bacteriocin [Acidovorax sp. NCPPB 4044]